MLVMFSQFSNNLNLVKLRHAELPIVVMLLSSNDISDIHDDSIDGIFEDTQFETIVLDAIVA